MCQVYRGNGTRLQRFGRIEVKIAFGGELTVTLQECLLHIGCRHRLNVFLEDGQRLVHLLGEEVGAGCSDLCHFYEERAKFTHHLCDDFGLALVVRGIGGKKLPYMTQGADLAAENDQVFAYYLCILQDTPHPDVIYLA